MGTTNIFGMIRMWRSLRSPETTFGQKTFGALVATTDLVVATTFSVQLVATTVPATTVLVVATTEMIVATYENAGHRHAKDKTSSVYIISK